MPKINPKGEDITRCHFPKHEGKFWEEVVEEDPDYIEWLISGEGPSMSTRLYDYLVELLEDR